jgi:Flp pilus assembly protein TadB
MRWLHSKLSRLPYDLLVLMTVFLVIQVVITLVTIFTGQMWIIYLTYVNLVVYFILLWWLGRKAKERRRKEAEEFLEASGILNDLFGKKKS